MRFYRVVAAAALAVIALARAAAAEPVEIRGAAHPGFGRIAFDWSAPVHFTAQLAGETLTVQFARRLEAQPDGLKTALGDYIADAALDGEGKGFVAHLKRPVTMTAFVVRDKTVVVDLTPVAAHKAAAAKSAAAKPAATANHPGAKVRISAKAKGGAVRVTFAWPHRVAYDFAAKDGTARLAFHEPGAIDADALVRAMPLLVPTVEQPGGATVVAMTVPAGIRLRHVQYLNTVTLEISGKPTAPTAPPAAAPAPTAAAEIPTTAPLAPAAATEAAPEPAPAPSPEAASPPPPPVASVAVRFSGDSGPSLNFDWPIATTAAVFRRGTTVWIVFGTPTALDLTDPLAHAQPAFEAITQVAAKDATVLRLVPREGRAASLRRSGTAWILEFRNQPAAPDAPIAFEARAAITPASGLFRVRGASLPVRLDDPDLGGALLVVPVGEVGRGVVAPPQLVDFQTLPSLQGIVIRPYADDLTIKLGDDAVTVSRPDGLAVSDEQDRLLGHLPERAHALFDFVGWLGPKDADFNQRRAALEREVTEASRGTRSQPRLALARFYFANFFAAETLAVLDALGRDDAALAGEPPVRALKGAACVLIDDRKCAADALGATSLDSEPEATLWRGALAAGVDDWEKAAQDFAESASLLPVYPKRLRIRFALTAAQAMLEAGRTNLAPPLIALVRNDHPEPADEAMALYLEGRAAQIAGRIDDALLFWDKAASFNDPPSRARALYARANALLDAGRASRVDTVKALDAQRFVWRGDAFEFTLLRRLGELKLAEGDQAGGLDGLQQAVSYFPDSLAGKEVAKEAADAFVALFLGKQADDLPPLKALVLYDRFHDLEPVGERRDQIVRKLIDRLVAVDLLDRAAGLLEEQVTKRLAGADKARGATQLALLRLMDHKPDAALQALDIDVGSGLPPELARPRQQLRARVLMELGRSNDALVLLQGDQTRDADRLRADIHWRNHDWKEAAKTLARLAGAPPADAKPDPETARYVVSLAAALTLGDDQPAVARLRTDWRSAMAGTSFAAAFGVLAGTGDPAGADAATIAVKVAQIGDLQSFIAAYKQKLASAK